MRLALATAAAMLLASALPTKAATFVQELPALQDIEDLGPFNITGRLFDPTLGTLTRVSALFTGTYVTTLLGVRAIADREIPTTIVYDLNGFGPGNHITGVAGTQFAFLRGGLTGGPYQFATSVVFPNAAEFIYPAGATFDPRTVLGDFSIFTRYEAGLVTSNDNSFGDNSSFSGTFQLTYTYDVPEPATLSIVSLSLISLGLLRRKSAPNRKAGLKLQSP